MDPALWELLRAEAGTDGDRVIEAIIRLARPGIEIPDVRIVSRFGTVATCRIRARDVVAVRARPEVLSVKAARGLNPGFEPAGDPAGLAGPAWTSERPTDARRDPGLTLTGAGVVVASVDWGVDVDSAAFRWPAEPGADTDAGETRFLSFWDQRDQAPGPRPDPYGYGTVHDRQEIDAALADPRPYQRLGYHPAIADPGGRGTHGTHVLDIAAGNGQAGGPVGIAPCADLIFVHLADHRTGGLGNFGDSVRLLEAVDFISRTAGSRPCVINISAGRTCGPKDGTTLVERALDELLAATPGRLVANSCGNYHDWRTHSCGRIGPGQTRSLTFVVDPADVTLNEIEVWYDGADEFAVRVTPPGYAQGRAVSLGERSDLLAEGRIIGRVYHREHDPNNGDNHIVAYIDPVGRPGRWTVTLEARRVTTGRFHAWIERDDICRGCQARFAVEDSRPVTTIGTIASSHLPLVVGAYDGHDPARPIAPFSSSGPSRDLRHKPDLAAPGVEVLAARSASILDSHNPGLLVCKSGTSMATPHVAGAMALCLEAAGDRLSAGQIRSLVLGSCDPASPPDADRLGHGYLNIPRLVADVQRALAIPVAVPTAKESAMDADDSTVLLAAAPATAYREFLYRPNGRLGRWIADRYDVVARPGERIGQTLRAGDVLLEVSLGRLSPGRCITFDAHDLELALSPPRLAPGQLLLRPRRRAEMSEPLPVEPSAYEVLAASGQPASMNESTTGEGTPEAALTGTSATPATGAGARQDGMPADQPADAEEAAEEAADSPAKKVNEYQPDDATTLVINMSSFDTGITGIRNYKDWKTDTSVLHNKRYNGYRTPTDIIRIVLHESSADVGHGFDDSENYTSHLAVQRDATIKQFNDLVEREFHATDPDLNLTSIGIEFVNRDWLASPHQGGEEIPAHEKDLTADQKTKFAEANGYLWTFWGDGFGIYKLPPPDLAQLEKEVELLTWLTDTLQATINSAPPQFQGMYPWFEKTWLQLVSYNDVKDKWTFPTANIPAAADQATKNLFVYTTGWDVLLPAQIKGKRGIISHNATYAGHPDGSFLALYTWLRMAKGKTGQQAYDLCKSLMKNHWIRVWPKSNPKSDPKEKQVVVLDVSDHNLIPAAQLPALLKPGAAVPGEEAEVEVEAAGETHEPSDVEEDEAGDELAARTASAPDLAEAGPAAPTPAATPVADYMGGKLWTFTAKTLPLPVAVFCPKAALARAGQVEVLLFVHGLLDPCNCRPGHDPAPALATRTGAEEMRLAGMGASRCTSEVAESPAYERDGRWTADFDELETAEAFPYGWLLAEVDRGSEAYAVWVQQSLDQVAQAGLAVDGKIGPLSRTAIKRFQAAHGLAADGVAGSATEAALVAAGASPPPGSTPGGSGTGPAQTPGTAVVAAAIPITIPATCVDVPALSGPDQPCIGVDSTRFAGIAEVATFAGNLADCYADRMAARRQRERYAKAQDEATRAATALQVPNETRTARAQRIAAARAAVQPEPVEMVRTLIRAAYLEFLEEEFRDTITGANNRWARKCYLRSVARMWMFGVRERLDFVTLGTSGRSLGSFAPPAKPASGDQLVDVEPPATTSGGAKVQPVMNTFLGELRSRADRHSAYNYPGHGGGSFNGRGYSIDLELNSPKDERGFYQRPAAAKFLLAIDAAARAAGVQWRAIYNDYAVAEAVNRHLDRKHVIFVGEIRRGRQLGLNWHGPLILHVHLDIAPQPQNPDPEEESLGLALEEADKLPLDGWSSKDQMTEGLIAEDRAAEQTPRVIPTMSPFRSGVPNALTSDSKLWDAFSPSIPFLKVNPGFAGLEDAAIVIVALSDDPAAPRPYVGHDAVRMFYSASMLKTAAMYTAYQLRAAVNDLGPSLSDGSDAKIFQQVRDAFDAPIRAAVPRITNAGKIMADKLTPKYEQIFKIWHDSPVKFDFKTGPDDPGKPASSFFVNLKRMIVGSHDESASACVRALGYNTINGALQSAGLFQPTTGNGIWLAGDYSFGRWPFVTVNSDNDKAVAQATTCFDMARLLVSINDDNLVINDPLHSHSDSGNLEMKHLLEMAVTDPDARTLLLRPFEPDTASAPFKVRQSKIGVGPLKGGSCPWNDHPGDRCTYSEAAVVEHSSGRKFVVVFQNLVLFKANSSGFDNGLKNITHIISKTMDEYIKKLGLNPPHEHA